MMLPHRMSPLVARLRHAACRPEYPLLGQDRKWLAKGQSVAIDRKLPGVNRT